MRFEDIPVRKGDPTPLYRQIAAALRDAVTRGALTPGQRLPPIRTLARMLRVSQVTAAQAYDLLIAEGVLASHVGRGTFVLERATGLSSAPPGVVATPSPISMPDSAQPESGGPDAWARALAPQIRAPRLLVVQRAHEQFARRGPGAPDPIYFSNAAPDPALFPLLRWRRSMRLAADRLTPDDRVAVQYGAALGDAALREFLPSVLRRHGIRAEPDEILLTSGTQQSLDLIARTFPQPGETVFVDELSYVPALNILEQQQILWRPLPVDRQGLVVEALPGLAGATPLRPRLLFIVPTGQSPTGVSTTETRRRSLAEMADRHNLVVVADEAFNELYLEGQAPVPAVHSFSDTGRVLSLLSFNKTIFPGVRMGCIVGARPLVALLAETKSMLDREASVPLARAILRHISAPAYPRELAHWRAEYRKRRDHLLALLRDELGPLGCRWTTPAAGFSLLLSLPPGVEEMALVDEAASQSVLVMPGQCFAPVPTARWSNSIRLSYGDLSFASMDEGVRRLARALRGMQHRRAAASAPRDSLPSLL